jgi:hypothetical protein
LRKSNLIDAGNAVAIANAHVRDAIMDWDAVLHNFPGDETPRIVIQYVRTPPEAVQQLMLQRLLAPGSPIQAVCFGAGTSAANWHERTAPLPPGSPPATPASTAGPAADPGLVPAIVGGDE